MSFLVLIRDAYLRTLFALSFLLILFVFVALYASIGMSTETLLIVHFDAYRGIDLMGSRRDLFFIPSLGLIALFINSALASMLYFRERFASLLVAFASFASTLLILIAILVIISVN
jgi:hypothetical protein